LRVKNIDTSSATNVAIAGRAVEAPPVAGAAKAPEKTASSCVKMQLTSFGVRVDP
jgi:hypothetical protein